MAEKAWERFLRAVPAEDVEKYERGLAGVDKDPSAGWAEWQQATFRMIDTYLDEEAEDDVERNIASHEAGGHLRIGMQDMLVRPRRQVAELVRRTIEARRDYNDKNLYHGFPDCVEVHHEIETLQYFQNALAASDFPGHELAKYNVLDVAEHTGNWVKGVPDWYDWKTSSFRSVYLGTRDVRAYAPYDYQEANHFRFVNEASLAYKLTREQRYLDLVTDYSDRWCRHIESIPEGQPIPCSILPEGAEFEEMGYSGNFKQSGKYQVFYNLVAQNTGGDLCRGLMNAYMLTGLERYLRAYERVLEQFIINGDGIRPAKSYANGHWIQPEEAYQKSLANTDPNDYHHHLYFTGGDGIPGLIRIHNDVTGSTKYRDFLLRWAETIDEDNDPRSLCPISVLENAHHFTGDASYLERAMKVNLRVFPITESNRMYHLCDGTTRQCSKGSSAFVYSSMLGHCPIGGDGLLPVTHFLCWTDFEKRQRRLPDGMSLRVWVNADGKHGFEAKDTSGRGGRFSMTYGPDLAAVYATVGGQTARDIVVPAGGSVTGCLSR